MAVNTHGNMEMYKDQDHMEHFTHLTCTSSLSVPLCPADFSQESSGLQLPDSTSRYPGISGM